MDEDEVEIDIDWEGWNDFVELDQTEEREEDWDYDDEFALVVLMREESVQADILICLTCGEVLVHCGCERMSPNCRFPEVRISYRSQSNVFLGGNGSITGSIPSAFWK